MPFYAMISLLGHFRSDDELFVKSFINKYILSWLETWPQNYNTSFSGIQLKYPQEFSCHIFGKILDKKSRFLLNKLKKNCIFFNPSLDISVGGFAKSYISLISCLFTLFHFYLPVWYLCTCNRLSIAMSLFTGYCLYS